MRQLLIGDDSQDKQIWWSALLKHSELSPHIYRTDLNCRPLVLLEEAVISGDQWHSVNLSGMRIAILELFPHRQSLLHFDPRPFRRRQLIQVSAIPMCYASNQHDATAKFNQNCSRYWAGSVGTRLPAHRGVIEVEDLSWGEVRRGWVLTSGNYNGHFCLIVERVLEIHLGTGGVESRRFEVGSPCPAVRVVIVKVGLWRHVVRDATADGEQDGLVQRNDAMPVDRIRNAGEAFPRCLEIERFDGVEEPIRIWMTSDDHKSIWIIKIGWSRMASAMRESFKRQSLLLTINLKHFCSY